MPCLIKAQKILADLSHLLNCETELLPSKCKYILPRCWTSKFKNSFVPAVFFFFLHIIFKYFLGHFQVCTTFISWIFYACLYIISFYHIALTICTNYFYFISGDNKYNSVQFNSVHEVALTSTASNCYMDHLI